MSRLTLALAAAGASGLLVVLGPLVAVPASAAAGPVTASQVAADPMPGMDAGPTPGMDTGPMPGMDTGPMPGMDHGPAATPAAEDHGSMPGMDAGSMPGAAHAPGEAAPVSRPLGWVLGGFVVVNGLLMAAAAVLRRRTPARRPAR